MGRPSLEVADIFRDHGPAWRAANAGHVSLDQLGVMRAIERCRTAVLGGHVARCEDCAHEHIAYNSCRNRHCPKCQAGAARDWLAAREAELLPVGYFHLVFTLPAPIADIAYQNKRVIYDLLMTASAKPLLDVSNEVVFAPATTPGPLVANTPPEVVISSPSDGATFDSGVSILFEGTATDVQDGDLKESLIWTWASSLGDGWLNGGESASSFPETLPDGSYTITASVTDSNLAPGSASVDITVGDPPPPPELSIFEPNGEAGYSMAGGRNGDKHMSVTVTVHDSLGFGVAGVSVTIVMDLIGGGNIPGTGTTDESGQVTFTWKNAPAGCYVTEVTDLDGIDPTTPTNEYCK